MPPCGEQNRNKSGREPPHICRLPLPERDDILALDPARRPSPKDSARQPHAVLLPGVGLLIHDDQSHREDLASPARRKSWAPDHSSCRKGDGCPPERRRFSPFATHFPSDAGRCDRRLPLRIPLKAQAAPAAVANGVSIGVINRVGKEASWNIGEFYGHELFRQSARPDRGDRQPRQGRADRPRHGFRQGAGGQEPLAVLPRPQA